MLKTPANSTMQVQLEAVEHKIIGMNLSTSKQVRPNEESDRGPWACDKVISEVESNCHTVFERVCSVTT